MRTILLKSEDARKSRIDMLTAVYESISNFIVSSLHEKGQITFYDLLDEALRDKTLKFEGDLSWCLLHVKRDLEAKEIIKVTLGVGPSRTQTIKLVKKKRLYLGGSNRAGSR